MDRDTHIVRIPSHIVEESIAKAPSSFVLCGRDPANDVLLEPGRVCFANFTEGLEVNDLRTGEHRVSVKQDIADAITVVDAMSEIDLALLPVAARDCEHAPSAHGYDAAVRSTTKHVHVPAINKAETEAVIEMAALISGGMDELRERPIMSAGACTVSPLKIPHDVSEVCLTMARAGLPDAPHGDDARRRHRAGDRGRHHGRAERGGARRADTRPARGAGCKGDLRLVDRRHGLALRRGGRGHPRAGA